MNDCTNRFAFVHQIERVVDVFQWHGVCDEIAQFKLAVLLLVNQIRQFAATFVAAKR